MFVQVGMHRHIGHGLFRPLRRLCLIAVVLLGLATTAGYLDRAARADTVPPTGQPATVSADRLPTAQINGVVWAQVTVGNTVYVTGSFSTARPAGVALGGAGTVTRSNLLAYDITTGVLSTTFVHSLNAEGRAIAASPDGSRVYVAGNFTTVDGASHARIAAFSTATGTLVSSFTASLNNAVYALAASNATVYAGGEFTTANGNTRNRLASFTAAGGLTTFNPGASATVTALTLTPDQTRLVAGGKFTTLGGAGAIGMGSVDATTGASRPWAANTVIQNSGSSATISTLSTDGNKVYGAGYFFTTGGTFEGRFAADPNTGQLVWMNNCHGDSYSVYPIGAVLYSAGHEHDCSDIGSFPQDDSNVFNATHHFVAAETTAASGGVNRHPIFPGGAGQPGPIYHDFAGQPSGTQLDWYPTLTEGSYTGQSQAAWSVSGNAQYLSVGGEFPSVNGTAQQGLVRFAVSSIAPNRIGPTAASSLTPIVVSSRAGTARVAWQATWDPDNTTLRYALYRDGGSTPIYQTSLDSTFWNRPNLGYLDTSLANGSSHSYRVTVTDPYGNAVSSGSASVTVSSAGAPDSYVGSVLSDGASHLWRLNESAGTTAADRAGYSDLALTGGVSFGVAGPFTGTGATAATFVGGETTPAGNGRPGPPPSPVPNDTAGTTGQSTSGGDFTVETWVKTTSTAGGALLDYGLFRSADSSAIDRVLYLDNSGGLHFGVQNNASKQTLDSGSGYNDGRWHLVDATLAGTSAALYVDGSLIASGSMTDDVAFPGYWRVGGDKLQGWTNAPAGNYLAGSLAAAAVYPTALPAARINSHYSTATGTTPANQPPTAAFTATCTGLSCAVDAGAGTDPDGTITSYSWDFGDAGAATGATATHDYAAAGTYAITVTVTDNAGATATASRTVTVAPVVTALADDSFNRSVAAGFGTADVGGAWTLTGSNYLSVFPGAGRITLPAAGRAGAYLPAVSSSSVDVDTVLSLDRIPASGNGIYLYVAGRYVSAAEQYLARLRVVGSTGEARLALSKYDGSTSTESTLAGEVSAGTVTAGAAWHVRVEVTGTAPTTVRARAWPDGSTEPSSWTVIATDSSAALQAAGAPGLQAYLSSSATNAPVTVSVSHLTATAI